MKTLHYDFATDKSLVANTGPTLVITRASSATYVNASGNIATASSGVARFTHDPVTLESLGLLVEEARTNICLYSADLSNAAWVASNVTKGSTSVTAPDGAASTTVRLTSTAANGTVLQSITSASATRAYSVYMKRVTGTGNIDLTTDGGSTWTTKTLTASWQRFDITQAAVTDPQVGVRIVTSGDAIDFWGSQEETGAFPTSYIPTTTASVTRNADVVETSDVSWYSADAAGSFYVDVTRFYVLGANNRAFDLDGKVYSVSVSTDKYWRHIAGTITCDSSGILSIDNVPEKIAFGYDTNDGALYIDGSLGATSATGTLPTAATQLHLGSRTNLGFFLNGHIAEFAYFNERLDNATLDLMSTDGTLPSEGNDFYIAVTRRTASQMRQKQRMQKPKRGLFR